jgi:lysophospholipase L1-like esterase
MADAPPGSKPAYERADRGPDPAHAWASCSIRAHGAARATILFQGDSITEGGRHSGDDPNHVMGQDHAYIASAQFGLAHPGCLVRFVNRGVSGNTIEDLAARWESDTIALKPDVLTILVGINDASAGKLQASAYARIYAALIRRTRMAVPGVRILLGIPFLLPVSSHRADYAAELARLRPYQQIVRDLARRERLALVDYQRAFDAASLGAPPDHWSWDGVHPTDAGHGLMAREWLRVAAPLLVQAGGDSCG